MTAFVDEKAGAVSVTAHAGWQQAKTIQAINDKSKRDFLLIVHFLSDNGLVFILIAVFPQNPFAALTKPRTVICVKTVLAVHAVFRKYICTIIGVRCVRTDRSVCTIMILNFK